LQAAAFGVKSLKGWLAEHIISTSTGAEGISCTDGKNILIAILLQIHSTNKKCIANSGNVHRYWPAGKKNS